MLTTLSCGERPRRLEALLAEIKQSADRDRQQHQHREHGIAGDHHEGLRTRRDRRLLGGGTRSGSSAARGLRGASGRLDGNAACGRSASGAGPPFWRWIGIQARVPAASRGLINRLPPAQVRTKYGER